MKTQLLTTIILFFALSLYGREITFEQAERFASDFLMMQKGVTSKSTSIIQLSDAGCLFQDEGHSVYTKSVSLSPSRDIYAFNINEDEGFILISGNDATKPVLGYSYENSLDVDHISPSVKAWLSAYKEQIRYVKKNDILATESIAQLWDLNSVKSKSEVIGVKPLITSKWNQSPYYNDSCPYDTVSKKRALTGCVATAMAQVMNYWEHPKQGKGGHTYTHTDYGVLSADFGATTYDWAAMPDTVSSANAAVATLCHHCGVAVEMNYGVDGSGAYDLPVFFPDQVSSFYALQTYFSYDTTIRAVRKVDFSGEEWSAMIKRELDLHHPIMYSASDASGAHAFICDGYDAYGFFHINWGWGGHYDGYFLLDILDAHGKGAGPHAFSIGQEALIGIQPTDKEIVLPRYENVIDIVGDVIIDTSKVNLGEGFTVYATLNYKGDSDYLASVFCGFLSQSYQSSFAAEAALYDMPMQLVLKPGLNEIEYHYTEGSFWLLPDHYSVGFGYLDDKNDVHLIVPENYVSYAEGRELIEVVNEDSISLCSGLLVNNSTVFTNDTLSVSVAITNKRNSVFTGNFSLMLYDQYGQLAAVLANKNASLLANSQDSARFDFFVENVNVNAGQYYLGIMHTQDGENFEVTGAGDFNNPVSISIQQTIAEDGYEYNDNYSSVYLWSPEFIDDKAKIKTEGANIHLANNWDVYGVVFDDGYQYDVDIELFDLYNKEEGAVYSLDVKFYYSLGRRGEFTWGGDARLENKISCSSGDTLYVAIRSYYPGERGDYALNMLLDRTKSVAIDQPIRNSSITLFPIPCQNALQLSGVDAALAYSIYNLAGQVQKRGMLDSKGLLDVSTLSSGIYLLQFDSQDKNEVLRFVKE